MSSDRREIWLVVGALLALAVLPLLGMAVSHTATVDAGTIFDADDGPLVEIGADTDADISEPFPDANTVSIDVTNVSGPEANVTLYDPTASDDLTTITFEDGYNATTDGQILLERDDVDLTVETEAGEFGELALDESANETDGTRDLYVETADSGVTQNVTIGGLPDIDAVSFVDVDTGAVFASSSVVNGQATLLVQSDTSRNVEVTTALPTLDDDSASPHEETRAPGETVTLSIDADHGNFGDDPDEFVNVTFYELDTGDPDEDEVLGYDNLTSAGTASTSWQLPTGQSAAEWYAVGEDQVGTTVVSSGFWIELDQAAADVPILEDGTADPHDIVIEGSTTDLSIDVTHENGTGEKVEVTFFEYDTGDPTVDDELGNTSVTTDDTATISDIDIGDGLQWYAYAEDDTDQTDVSAVFSVASTGFLNVRDAEDGSLVDDRTVRLSVTGPDYSETFDRTDGVLNYSDIDLSADSEIIIDIQSEMYFETTFQVPQLTSNDTIYLQRGPGWVEDPPDDDPTNTSDPEAADDMVVVTFVLDDQTGGNFPAEETTLDISDANGTIHAEEFGALNRVSVILERNERYQLSVDGPDDSRSLGGFTATQSETVEVTVGERDFSIPEADGYTIDAWIDDDPEEINFVVVEYSDPNQNTSSLDITIHERGNQSNVIFEESLTDLGNWSGQVAITDNQTAMQWVVDYEGIRNGEEFEGQIPVGGDSLIPLPGGTVLTAFVLIALTIGAALYSGPLATMGAMILVGGAGVAILFGWLPVSPLIWFAAAVVAVAGFARTVNHPFN